MPIGPTHIEVNPLSVFSMKVWNCIIATGISIGCLLVVDKVVRERTWMHPVHAASQLLNRATESVLLFAGTSVQFRRPQIFLGLWALVSTVLAGLYSGVILVEIVGDKRSVPFTDMASLAHCVYSKYCYIFSTAQNSLVERLTEARDLTAEELHLHNAVKGNQIRISSNVSNEIFGSAPGTSAVLMSTKITAKVYMFDDKNHSPTMYYQIDGAYTDLWCFPTRKHSVLTSLLSKATMIARETGLIDAIYNKYLPSTDSAGTMTSHGPIPLNVSMITGALIIIGIGLTCSLLIFAAERFGTACKLKELESRTQKKEMSSSSISFHHQDLAIAENLTVTHQCKSKLKEVLQIVEDTPNNRTASDRLNRLNQFLDSWLHECDTVETMSRKHDDNVYALMLKEHGIL